MAKNPQILAQITTHIKNNGPISARELQNHFGISQSHCARLLEDLKEHLLITGSGRNTEYVMKRDLSFTQGPLPIFQINPEGSGKHIANLHSIYPQGFYVQNLLTGKKGDYFEDLPYFLDDMRPSGFLGRLIPKKYPELKLPNNVTHWNASHCLEYFSKHGSNLIGNLIIGNGAYAQHLEQLTTPVKPIAPNNRQRTYNKLATDMLLEGQPGTSAAGEQPKFLTNRAGKEAAPVLVKFSPPLKQASGKRWSDLLICEHLAHNILKKHNIPAATSQILVGKDRCFLEVERFDRVGIRGRRGLITLSALSLGTTGSLEGTWTELAQKLYQDKALSKNTLHTIMFLDVFGDLIANTDRHPENLSFFMQDLKSKELAPAYDMLPMLYKPINGEVTEPNFAPKGPKVEEAPVWPAALGAAQSFWNSACKNPRITKAFQKLAKKNLQKLSKLETVVKFLPQ